MPKRVRDATIIELLLGSGLRVSEACALKIGHVHLQDGSPAVFVRRGKGGRPRLVPISSRLASRLATYLESKAGWGELVDADGPLFLGQHGVELTRFGLSKIWKVALAAAGLADRWGIH
ncbi:MAG TPA: tyrosine-type recombinase/integrase, partial [Polyangiaceae bacterium]